MNLHLIPRLVAVLIIFVLWTVYVFYYGGGFMTGSFWFVPEWVLYGIMVSFALAFIDLLIRFLMLMFVVLFLGMVVLFIGYVGYDLFIVSPSSISPIAESFKRFIPAGNVYSDLGFGIFFFVVLFLFAIPYIYRRHKRKQANAEARAEERISSWQAEDKGNTKSQNNGLEKGEIGRILNYWQQKFASAPDPASRQIANDKIRYYTDLLSSLNDDKKGKGVIEND